MGSVTTGFQPPHHFFFADLQKLTEIWPKRPPFEEAFFWGSDDGATTGF